MKTPEQHIDDFLLFDKFKTFKNGKFELNYVDLAAKNIIDDSNHFY